MSLSPRADGGNGLVALASIVSKTVREVWMDVFNAYWLVRVPGLKPTAGYPVDAARFRRAIEPTARAAGLDPDSGGEPSERLAGEWGHGGRARNWTDGGSRPRQKQSHSTVRGRRFAPWSGRKE